MADPTRAADFYTPTKIFDESGNPLDFSLAAPTNPVQVGGNAILTGSGTVGPGSQRIVQGSVALTQAYVSNAAASGDFTLAAAAVGASTKAYRAKLSVAGATIVTIKDGATTIDRFDFVGAGVLLLPYSVEAYWFTSTNSALVANSSAAVNVAVKLDYLTNSNSF